MSKNTKSVEEMTLVDKNGKPVVIGTTLVAEGWPTSTCRVVSIKDYGAGPAIETDLGRWFNNEIPHRINQPSLIASRWIVLDKSGASNV